MEQRPDALQRAAGPAPVSREPLTSLEAMAELARIDFARYDLRGVLGEIAGLARACIVGAAGETSITLIRDRHAYTAAFTGEPALALDEIQYANGAGPCLDAAVSGQVQQVADMAAETRWRGYARAATDVGIFSSLSLPLPLLTTITGALNVYSTKPAAFDDDAARDGPTRGCVERLTGSSVSHWAAVPSPPAKPGRHAMATIAEIVPQGPEVVLEAAASVTTRRAVNEDHFRVITPPLPQGSHVLLFDDTWTTGGHVQSAALALRAAGAQVVSALVVARWLQPGYAPTDEFVRTRLRTDFSPAVCPWTGTGCP